jgi:hypothetical protein
MDFGSYQQQHGGGQDQMSQLLQLFGLLGGMGQGQPTQAQPNWGPVMSALAQAPQGPSFQGGVSGISAQQQQHNQLVDDAIRRALGGQ